MRLACAKGGVDDALGALRRDDAEVDRQIVRDVHPLAANGVHVLGVLTEKCPVNTLGGHPHGAHVGEQVEDLAHADVGAFEVRPAVALLRSVGRAFQRHVAVLDLSQHIVGNGLHVRSAVFDGQAVDNAENHLAARHLIAQQVFQDLSRLFRDGRANAVAAQNADDNGADRIEVEPIGLLLEAFHPLELLSHDPAEVRLAGFDLCFVRQDRLLM